MSKISHLLRNPGLLCVLLAVCYLLLAPQAWSTGEYCDDWEREDKPRAAQIKAKIKANARAAGVPERLMHLYDALPDCEMCLEDTSPTPFITIDYVQGGPRMVDWDADMEYDARYGLKTGYVKAFYIHVAASKCVCCTANNEEEYEDWEPYPDDVAPSPGWVDELDLDISLSDAYTDPDQLGEDPPDLTNIDASDAFPDMIEPPPLVMPPPIRPMTTLCTQCQPTVDAHNDHLKTIRQKQREIAKLKQRLAVTRKAISYRIRAIDAHARKAQVGDWEDVLDSMQNHRYDLEATEREDIALIAKAQGELSALLETLERLRQQVHECEARCRLEDSQAMATLAPTPITFAEDAPLPPYIRIASQACNECRGAMEARNDLARRMNRIVGEMLASGYTQERLGSWNALQAEFESANLLLRQCLAACGKPEADKQAPSVEEPAATADPSANAIPKPETSESEQLTRDEINEQWLKEFNLCKPCNEYWHRYREAIEKLKPLKEQLGKLQNEHWVLNSNIRMWTANIDSLSAKLKFDLPITEKRQANEEIRNLKRHLSEAEAQLHLVKTRIRRTHEAVQAAERIALLVKAEWRHCVATKCRLATTLAGEMRTDQMGYPEQDQYDELTMLLFVSTTCEPCAGQARETNDWLLEQYKTWLADYMVKHHGKPYKFDADFLSRTDTNSEPGPWPAFWENYQLRVVSLRECEKQCVAEIEAPPEQNNNAYLAPNIGGSACTDGLKDSLFSDPDKNSKTDELPPSCQGDAVYDWYESDCGSAVDAQTPPSCQLSPAFDQYSGDCDSSSEDCDNFSDQSQSSQSSCEYETEIENGNWRSPIGCLGAPRQSQTWKIDVPSDPAVLSMDSIRKGLRDSWGLQRIKLFSDSGKTPLVDGQAVVVAVIDSGIDHSHPDLRGMIWENSDEIADNGIDDDSNGYVDDVRGWNFVANSPATEDFNGHGTLVSGILAAKPNNGLGIAGVNPWARIMPLKVTNYLGKGYSSDIAAAIIYAVNNGASIINLSLGGTRFSPAEEKAVAYASNNNVLVVVAAGNLGTDTANFWPAGLSEVLTVAALDSDGKRAGYSNWGEAIDIAAPGSDILSLRARFTDPVFLVDENYEKGIRIVGDDKLLYYVSGTSFAAPYVSGAASLLLALEPELSAKQIKQMLEQNADDIEKPGLDLLTGFGSLNVGAALNSEPEYHVTASIERIAAVQKNDETYVEIIGSAGASNFASATISLGEGTTPSSWRLIKTLSHPVEQGQLALVPARDLAGAARWQIRLTTQHANGKLRVEMFDLSLQ